MSGKRCKRLREAFFARYGRYPKRARISTEPVKLVKALGGGVVGVTLPGRPWELVKKRSLLKLFTPTFERKTILRPLFSVTVNKPSEWRRWKKTRGDAGAFEVRMGWRAQEARDSAVLPATEVPV